MSSIHEIFISPSDARELERLLSAAADNDETNPSALQLGAKLFDAQVVSPATMPHGTIGLGATVTYEELSHSRRRRVTLVRPAEADAAAGRISVLSPVGIALLGNRANRVVEVALPGDRRAPIRVVDVDAVHASRVVEPAVA